MRGAVPLKYLNGDVTPSTSQMQRLDILRDYSLADPSTLMRQTVTRAEQAIDWLIER